MPTKKVVPTKKSKRTKPLQGVPEQVAQDVFDEPIRRVAEALANPIAPRKFKNPSPMKLDELRRRLAEAKVTPPVDIKKLLETVNRMDPKAVATPLREEVRASVQAMRPVAQRFHGAKVSLSWFPFPSISTPCSDKFGYNTPAAVRTASALPFNTGSQVLLGQLGGMMADSGRETAPDSTIPAGYTYFGQFVDHDITLDVSSSLDAATDANTVSNMRSPALDLDSVYGNGPALDPFLYVFPSSGPPTAIQMALGTNTPAGLGGPGGTAGFGGMLAQTNYDVPRMHNTINPAASTLTAVIGDPRNDENLIVSQFHHAMLKFHNNVMLNVIAPLNPPDIFLETKKVVTHHYQWAVVKDYLTRICGAAAVNDAITTVVAPIGSAFRMPVEFAVGAYRFGHSMARDRYWINFIQINASLADVFAFNRKPNLPVLSNWAVDFNAFFTTGVAVPVNNKARPIDSNLANKLESLPDLTGMMAILATRNLRRSLALGLPSGQAAAAHFGVPVLTNAELIQGLPAAEVAILNAGGGLLAQKTPLWYYVLREAAVKFGGNQLGPLGAKIVAETFIRMLKRDAGSFLNVSGGFTPFLPSAVSGDFTVADLVIFAGVTQP